MVNYKDKTSWETSSLWDFWGMRGEAYFDANFVTGLWRGACGSC